MPLTFRRGGGPVYRIGAASAAREPSCSRTRFHGNLLSEKDVAQLAERYGIVIRDPICGPDMPAPDLARLDRQ